MDNVHSGQCSTIRAYLFDFDGTLVDSYPAITASVNHVRAHHGLEPLPEPEVRKHVGYGPGHLLNHTVGMGDTKENESLYRAHHPTIMREKTTLLPGAREMLGALKEKGHRLAICSNKPSIYTRALLSHLEIDLFDAVLGPGDVKRRKPAPDMLLMALERLDIPKDQAVYVGDMTVDIQAARRAGLRAWVVPTGSCNIDQLTKEKPDRLLNQLMDIIHG